MRPVDQLLNGLCAGEDLDAAETASVFAELGKHPDSGAAIQIKTGRFGPYVTDGTVNASVPKGTDPEVVTLEAAVELLAAREHKLRSQGKDPRAPKKAARRRKR